MRIYTSFKVRAFTLVELAIVLIIIGLILGGISAGISVTKNSQLQSVVVEFSKLDAAFYTFTTTYRALPGNMSNASSYWSGAANGSGNGWAGGGLSGTAEFLYQAQHLSLAGLIPGNYSTAAPPRAGVNMIASIYGIGSAYWARTDSMYGIYSTGATQLVLSGTAGASGHGYTDMKITVQDAYAIDKKLDDGMPGMGKLIAANEGAGVFTCTSFSYPALGVGGAIPANQSYLISGNGYCYLLYGLYGYVFRGGGV